MPKAEFGTPKWMSNKIKASGLQKLRWYCQMCQKQCRDENGFKCHRMSEGHQRAMQLFIQRPGKFMDEFSKEFEEEFMKLMRTRYCRTRVLANSVYNNVVCDRHHIHMNSTIWVTLSEFVQYLGATQKCKIELTPKGWYVEYIDHDELARKKEEEKRRKIEKSLEDARMERIEAMVEEARQRGDFIKPEYTPLQRQEGQTISFTFNKPKPETKERKVNALQQLHDQLKQERRSKSDGRTEKRKVPEIPFIRPFDIAWMRGKLPESFTTSPRSFDVDVFLFQLSAMEALVLEAEQRKQKTAAFERKPFSEDSVAPVADSGERKGQDETEEHHTSSQQRPPPHKYADADWWLQPGLIVKVMHKTLGDGKYYKQKGVVKSVDGRYAAVLEMLEGGAILKLDQEYLETVIPVRIFLEREGSQEAALLLFLVNGVVMKEVWRAWIWTHTPCG
ncbi:hypothetical protein, conserved [Eimeria maxima]|uniref:DNA/RNA-binding protein Kin17 WH-like domain-containing protein n=1 Tax=Eimeria maxima TaxID=5804 RepID=U6MBE1_EIMMA|nr:hypothetical protein, conserved [Eimeria maxima]CDJ59794.1 hypothetical protein, conserved [Eimeria maxima]